MNKNLKNAAAALGLALSLGVSVFAQSGDMQSGSMKTGTMQTGNMQTATPQNVASGQKLKLRGIVLDRTSDSFTIRDEKTNQVTNVKVAGSTKIKSKKYFGAGDSFAANFITRGLFLSVDGRGDGSGSLLADNIKIGKDDLRAAQALEARVNPVEGRLSEAEQNAQALSGKLDELAAISNAARGGAKSAQDTADAAVAGVNATNQRITDVDDFTVGNTATVNFKVGSAVLSTEGKTQLDTLSQNLGNLKGYVIEVTGYADATGDTDKNRALSERRAETVRRYLVENHGVPLRRILQSYGFGASNAVADNKTRDGRAQNRRVEVKLLISKGLTNSVEVQNPNNQNNPQPGTQQPNRQ